MENALAQYFGISSSYARTQESVFELYGNVSLNRKERDELNSYEIEFQHRYPDALVLLNLSGLHRLLTYHLCSVWNLLCHSDVVVLDHHQQMRSSNRRQPKSKVVIVQVGSDIANGVEFPVFPVSENLVAILTRPPNRQARIKVKDEFLSDTFNKQQTSTPILAPATRSTNPLSMTNSKLA